MPDAAKAPPKPAEAKPAALKAEKPAEECISIDEFDRVKLRVARVLTAERVEGSDKLLKLTLRLGPNDPERTVASGIAKFYAPQDLVGRQVVLVANLKPAKLRGIRSEGMILCASDADDQRLTLVTVAGDMEDGAYIR